MSKEDGPLELLRGFLRFYSETGVTEGGGHWAFQDSLFRRPNISIFSCSKCYKYWDKEKHPDGPPDIGDESIVVSQVIPLEKFIDEMDKENFKSPKLCPPNEHDFQLMCPEFELFEGHHVLEDGDWLTVYSKDEPKTVLWSGIIKLKKYPPFTESALNMWIRSDQENTDRETWAGWFLEGYPATLIPYVKINASN